MGGHGSCYLVGKGEEDDVTYWRYVAKYSDAQETAFKRAVALRAGRCRSVRREQSQPQGTEI